MRNRLTGARGWGWAIGVAAVAVAAQLVAGGAASAIRTTSGADHLAGTIAPAKTGLLDCNGWSPRYRSAANAMRMRCTDPHGPLYDGRRQRFYDNGHYVGHDEPTVKFISSLKGSGNTMTYVVRLPRDPARSPTASGSVTDYGELSVAPWFGLPMCDPHSYPQNPCTPDSDSNSGLLTNPSAAGSAFLEMQFYPPGFTPFLTADGCSRTQWCAALNIDSAECTFNFASCNGNCLEPVNFSFIQTNGVPPGPPAPQDPDAATFLGNARTLRMNPGDVVTVAMTDPPGGFTVRITDHTTHQTGWMQASAGNGFANTNMSDCSGNPFTWHAEYSTARKQNQVPWAALEGGVLMEQEIGHGEACGSIAHKDGFAAAYSGGSSYTDPDVFQTCAGGQEGRRDKGEGPCNVKTGVCQNSRTEGRHGPVACTVKTTNCELADGYCLPRGARPVTVNGLPGKQFSRLDFCFQDQFQNGDLDFDGTGYRADWPNGSHRRPQTFRYLGPFTRGHAYRQVQFETDAPASEELCNVATGKRCVVPPIGSAGFYPFWSLSNKETLTGIARRGACLWNFGNVIARKTVRAFGRDNQYGRPDLARYGGTAISKVRPNPALGKGCRAVT